MPYNKIIASVLSFILILTSIPGISLGDGLISVTPESVAHKAADFDATINGDVVSENGQQDEGISSEDIDDQDTQTEFTEVGEQPSGEDTQSQEETADGIDTLAEDAQISPLKDTVLLPSGQNMSTYSGAIRYDSTQAIANATTEYDTYEGIIVATGDNGKYADALAAAGLSGMANYPIVLVNGNDASLNVQSQNAVATMAQQTSHLNIIIVGGPAAVSSGIEHELSSFGSITRVFGNTRYETESQIYQYGKTHFSWNTEYAIIASGHNFPDALSISSYSAANNAHIFLVEKNATSFSPQHIEAFSEYSKVLVLGGEVSVSAALYNQVIEQFGAENTVRFAGATRYETCALALNWQLNNDMCLNGIGFATGESFPDALSAGFLLSKTKSVLCIVEPAAGGNSHILTTLAENRDNVTAISFYGGPACIAPSTRTSLVKALEWTQITHHDKIIYRDGAYGDGLVSGWAWDICAKRLAYMNGQGLLAKAAGWIPYDGSKRYVDAHGFALTNRQNVEGKTYYFDTKTAKMHVGWLQLSGGARRYYDNSGVEVSGWLYDKYYYYLDPQNQNIMVRGRNVYAPNGSGNPVRSDFSFEGRWLCYWTGSGSAWLDGQLDRIVRLNNYNLRSCFNYVASYKYITMNLYPSGNWAPLYAEQMISNNGGNCYRYAALFSMLAWYLGYDSNAISGHIATRSGWGAHGWCEIRINGTTFVFDPQSYQAFPQYNFYMFTYGNSVLTYRK